ncbi:MAG: ATP-binding protein [Candidatus Improbicoccus devescovinae]|nr:MAG: ATP-binding protein [Candidatus Improbicoccus devescovinae]
MRKADISTFFIQSKIENWLKLQKKLYNFTKKNSISNKNMNKICLACEEIFVNICKYSQNKFNDSIEINIILEYNKIKIIFKYSGIKFDPLDHEIQQKTEKELKKNVENRQIGGMGIRIIKKIMDEIKYERKNGENYFFIFLDLEGD